MRFNYFAVPPNVFYIPSKIWMKLGSVKNERTDWEVVSQLGSVRLKTAEINLQDCFLEVDSRRHGFQRPAYNSIFEGMIIFFQTLIGRNVIRPINHQILKAGSGRFTIFLMLLLTVDCCWIILKISYLLFQLINWYYTDY